jgi:hypothetical protein
MHHQGRESPTHLGYKYGHFSAAIIRAPYNPVNKNQGIETAMRVVGAILCPMQGATSTDGQRNEYRYTDRQPPPPSDRGIPHP